MNPLDLFDLRDATGKVDNQKIVPLLFLVAAVVFHAIGNRFAWWELVILSAVAFGPRMYGLFLRRSSFTFGGQLSTSESTSVSEQITATRDHELGIEPTP